MMSNAKRAKAITMDRLLETAWLGLAATIFTATWLGLWLN